MRAPAHLRFVILHMAASGKLFRHKLNCRKCVNVYRGPSSLRQTTALLMGHLPRLLRAEVFVVLKPNL